MKTTAGLVAILATLLLWQKAEAQESSSTTLAPQGKEIIAELSITGTLQQVPSGGAKAETRRRRGTYRGDVTTTIPAPAPHAGRGTVYGHLRFGKGEGVLTRPVYTGSVNSAAFDRAGGSSFAILAQLSYQIDIPLRTGASQASGRIALTAGKLDPFVFFDQNEVSDDETNAFLNNVFVHNPLLDSGGDIGTDGYGFSPGLRAAWFSENRYGFGASFGIFGTGRGAVFRTSPGKPFLIAQVELAPKRGDGEVAGHYRLYTWSNSQALSWDGSPAKHMGWGASLDHRISKDLNLFGRLGRRTRGQGRFNKAFTFGAELLGTGWRRPQDALGIALGRLPTGEAYRLSGGSEAAGGASGAEQILEIFYRHTLSDKLEISPGFQLISRGAGDRAAPIVRVAGVRIKLSI